MPPSQFPCMKLNSSKLQCLSIHIATFCVAPITLHKMLVNMVGVSNRKEYLHRTCILIVYVFMLCRHTSLLCSCCADTPPCCAHVVQTHLPVVLMLCRHTSLLCLCCADTPPCCAHVVQTHIPVVLMLCRHTSSLISYKSAPTHRLFPSLNKG